jgi:hypothetical protein
MGSKKKTKLQFGKKPMVLLQGWSDDDGNSYARLRIVEPTGDVYYSDDNIWSATGAWGCTSRPTQLAALRSVETYFESLDLEAGPLVFLGYL